MSYGVNPEQSFKDLSYQFKALQEQSRVNNEKLKLAEHYSSV